MQDKATHSHENCNSHQMGTVGQVVALLCFIHCSIFIVAYGLLSVGIVILPAAFLPWFDNVWIHIVLACVATLIGVFDLALAGRKVKGWSIALVALGVSLMASSIYMEFSIHHGHEHGHHHAENAIYDDHGGYAEHSEQAKLIEALQEPHDHGSVECEHCMHSPLPHFLFIAGNLCILAAHRVQHHGGKKKHSLDAMS